MNITAFIRDPLRRVCDVVMPNPFGRVTVPLPLFFGDDCRDVYVMWDRRMIEIVPLGDGTFLPYANTANTAITSEPTMPHSTTIILTPEETARVPYCVDFRSNGVSLDRRTVNAENENHALHLALAAANAALGLQGRTLAYEHAVVSIGRDCKFCD